jgi:hypothetical protein
MAIRKTTAVKKSDPPKKGKPVKVEGPIYNATRRAPLMTVPYGKGGKMAVDTTSMSKPDPKTFNYTITGPDGSVIRKGNLSQGIGNVAAKDLVGKLAVKLKSKK